MAIYNIENTPLGTALDEIDEIATERRSFDDRRSTSELAAISNLYWPQTRWYSNTCQHYSANGEIVRRQERYHRLCSQWRQRAGAWEHNDDPRLSSDSDAGAIFYCELHTFILWTNEHV